MKTSKQLHSLLVLLLGAILFTACKKDFQGKALDKKTEEDVLAWLEKQKRGVIPSGNAATTGTSGIRVVVNGANQSGSHSGKNANIDLLEENLDFGAATLHGQSDQTDLIVVPIKEELKTKKNLDKSTSLHLLLTCEKSGKILAGNIVHFFPSDRRKHEYSNDVVSNLLSNRPVTENGTFKLLDVMGRLKIQFEYKDGQRVKTGLVQGKKQDKAVNLVDEGHVQTCTQWYMIWTVTINGMILTTTDDLGITCQDCLDTQYENICGTDESGGSPDDTLLWGYISVKVHPQIPSNDSTFYMATGIVAGHSGIFTYKELQPGTGSTKVPPGCTYNSRGNICEISNPNTPNAVIGIHGDVYTNNTSYPIDYNRSYTYQQAFP